MSESAGYSKRPLMDKLGVKPGMQVAVVNPPDGYALPSGVITPKELQPQSLDFIHLFLKQRSELENFFPGFKPLLVSNGMIWVSWPKKASKVETDLDENIIREFGLAIGLVDVKVAAVDQVWSGLKFVFRLKDRS